MSSQLDKKNLHDIPKDVIIKHIIPNIQTPLINEINQLKSIIIKMSDKLDAAGLSVCTECDGHSSIECSFCNKYICKTHPNKKSYHYQYENSDHLLINQLCETCATEDNSDCECDGKCDLSQTHYLIPGKFYVWDSSKLVWTLKN